MVLKVIGAGLGRTGTLSLMEALDQLGFGPCHHMRRVFEHMSEQVPLWQAAARGEPNWEAIFQGYVSAVDWPVASFYRELHAAYPDAKFILTQRSPESWFASFSETIRKLIAAKDQLPREMQAWHEMTTAVQKKAGIVADHDEASLIRAFNAHNESVKAAIPASQLLVFEVKEGWAPLCKFLNVALPASQFPRTNDSKVFWDNKPVNPDGTKR